MCTPPRTSRKPTQARAVGSSTSLVDADLVRAGAALEEEVVQQVELEVAAGEDVGPRPEVALRVHRERLLSTGQKMVAVARIGGAIASGVSDGSSPRSVVPVRRRLIA